MKNEFDFEKFKKHNKRNLIILDKVFELMKPIFEETDCVEISIVDGHPQMTYTHETGDFVGVSCEGEIR